MFIELLVRNWCIHLNGMADSHRSGFPERDIEQAIASLKKGTQLLKYGRRGKPKFCPFRLSNDETMLMWFSGKEEKFLNLSQVSRLIPGQRTAIFQRYPRPEKEYQSFSLLYSDRSLDLICKDKDEADVWFVALKALISRPNYRKSGVESSRGSISSESTQSVPRRSSPSVAFELGETRHQIPLEAPKGGLGKAFSDIVNHTASIKKNDVQGESISHALSSLSAAHVDQSNGRSSTSEFRISLSSAVSSSSQGSHLDDFDALGAVFMWGEGVGSGLLGGGSDRVEKSSTKADALQPRPLESTVALKVNNIACGRKHAMLVTKQGELYSWGEELGGRLGHGVEADVSHPKFIDALGDISIDVIACGEYHSCAVSHSGDLYTWGDGAHNIGLLGHGSEVSHWIPKKVGGFMDSMQIVYISCGSWHTAIVSSSGKLFTFGDGTFGALGHGGRSSTSVPREVETFSGLRTLKVACGVWHSAAVVETVTEYSDSDPENSCGTSAKLFTWGDGDKYQLGHGDRESKLMPVMVTGMGDEIINDVACGYSLTVTLTTKGHVYTMGSAVYGQLGNPEAKGKVPTRVQGNIANSFVEGIACGFYHAVVLTSQAQVYTWGRGAEGQLGHGDTDNRNLPAIVTFLKDKQVKSVACGPNYSAAICPHQWASSVDHSICAGCHNEFGLRRKRHNCYNCGLAFCKACSSKKSLKAAMALDQSRPYRVCDDCFTKIKKAMDAGPVSRIPKSRSSNFNLKSGELIDLLKPQRKLSRLLSISSFNLLENHQPKPAKNARIFPQVSQGIQWSELRAADASNYRVSSVTSPSRSVPLPSRASPVSSRNASPPPSTLPSPTAPLNDLISGSKISIAYSSQENLALKEQVKDLTSKTHHLEQELERTIKQLNEAKAAASEESAKYKSAMEVIESLTAKLNVVVETNQQKPYNKDPTPRGEHTDNPLKLPSMESHTSSSVDAPKIDVHKSFRSVPKSRSEDADTVFSSESKLESEKVKTSLSNGSKTDSEKEKTSLPNGTKTRTEKSSTSRPKAEGDKSERVVQDEPGVYVTLIPASAGGNELKRVRFSRKRFTEEHAEKWWAENGAKLCEKYDIRVT